MTKMDVDLRLNSKEKSILKIFIAIVLMAIISSITVHSLFSYNLWWSGAFKAIVEPTEESYDIYCLKIIEAPSSKLYGLWKRHEYYTHIYLGIAEDPSTWTQFIDLREIISEEIDYKASSDMLVLNNGSLLLIGMYEATGLKELAVSVSSDEGLTWSQPNILIKLEPEVSRFGVYQEANSLVKIWTYSSNNRTISIWDMENLVTIKKITSYTIVMDSSFSLFSVVDDDQITFCVITSDYSIKGKTIHYNGDSWSSREIVPMEGRFKSAFVWNDALYIFYSEYSEYVEGLYMSQLETIDSSEGWKILNTQRIRSYIDYYGWVHPVNYQSTLVVFVGEGYHISFYIYSFNSNLFMTTMFYSVTFLVIMGYVFFPFQKLSKKKFRRRANDNE
ncbi:MAG: hypothetical protein ACFFC7_21535 [Candidatus Hermodarchaeota archaeon]